MTGEDSYLEKAKRYDFGKDLGAKHAVAQVWKLTKQDYKYYIIGVGFTMLGTLAKDAKDDGLYIYGMHAVSCKYS